jgi:hypothetical protein
VAERVYVGYWEPGSLDTEEEPERVLFFDCYRGAVQAVVSDATALSLNPPKATR